jgi:nucleoside-diphosphate-sugar epimerase
MKILIIGGTGRISLSVTRELDSIGFDVTVINRGKDNSLISQINTFVSDINDTKKIENFLKDKGYDVVIDFVSFNKEDILRSYSYFKGHTNHYIFVSSVVVYSHDNNSLLINESSTLGNPFSEYARKKIEAEEALKNIGKKDPSFKYTIVRFGQTFDERNLPVCIHGKNGTYEVLYRILNEQTLILPSEKVSWKMLYAPDAVFALIPLFKNEKTYGEIYNVVAKETYSWDEIYTIIGNLVNKKVKIVHIPLDVLCEEDNNLVATLKGDKGNNANYDLSKILDVAPNFSHQTHIEDALKLTLCNILHHPEYQKRDSEFSKHTDEIISIYEKNLQKN